MRCLIVESQPITLFGMRRLLEQEFPDWSITPATITQAMDELRIARLYPFDIVLLNVTKDNDRVLQYLARLKSLTQGKCRSLILHDKFDDTAGALYRKHGATGYISKEQSICELVDAISAITMGQNYFPGEGLLLTTEILTEPKLSDSVRLTSRQKDLVRLVLRGYSNKQIANALGLTSGTVKNYLFSLMRIYCVNSRGEMIAKLLSEQTTTII
jgi:DNA-binding NarL/FixJ family response regulator